MHQLSLTNTTIVKKLSNIAKVVDSNAQKLDQICDGDEIKIKDKLIPEHIGYSEDYLKEALDQDVLEYGFPRTGYCVDTNVFDPRQSLEWYHIISPHIGPVMNYLGGPRNSLACYYPPGGYLGWHHNGNASGYNTLLTYNPDGKGFFKYYDQRNDQFVTLQDNPGWNIRFGYFPNYHSEPENVFWHTAYTDSYRLTLGFVVLDRMIWENIIYELTGVDEIPESIKEMGPADKNAPY